MPPVWTHWSGAFPWPCSPTPQSPHASPPATPPKGVGLGGSGEVGAGPAPGGLLSVLGDGGGFPLPQAQGAEEPPLFGPQKATARHGWIRRATSGDRRKTRLPSSGYCDLKDSSTSNSPLWLLAGSSGLGRDGGGDSRAALPGCGPGWLCLLPGRPLASRPERPCVGLGGVPGQARVAARRRAALHLGTDLPATLERTAARLGLSPRGPRPRPLCHAHEGAWAEKECPSNPESLMKSTFLSQPAGLAQACCFQVASHSLSP